jgi:hypothetical protein
MREIRNFKVLRRIPEMAPIFRDLNKKKNQTPPFPISINKERSESEYLLIDAISSGNRQDLN